MTHYEFKSLDHLAAFADALESEAVRVDDLRCWLMYLCRVARGIVNSCPEMTRASLLFTQRLGLTVYECMDSSREHGYLTNGPLLLEIVDRAFTFTAKECGIVEATEECVDDRYVVVEFAGTDRENIVHTGSDLSCWNFVENAYEYDERESLGVDVMRIHPEGLTTEY